MKELDYTPLKSAFIFRRVAVPLALFILLSIGALALAAWAGAVFAWAIVVMAVLAGVAVLNAFVAYKKQTYRFSEKAIYFTTGALFTDRETELRYKNITHVRVVRPFLEHKLFGTGKILIEAAGSSGTEVLMQSIPEPLDAYRQLQANMAANGFRLTYEDLLLKRQPARIAVILEIIGGIIGFVFFASLLLADAGITLAIFDVVPWMFVASAILVVVLAASIVIYAHYQDMMRRTYYIYDDVISYRNGFLTRQDAFMPVENLSDSRVTQNFMGKLLNLHDVVISCQGSGSEITFGYLQNGQDVENTIDGLINRAQPVEQPAEQPSLQEQPQQSEAGQTQQQAANQLATPKVDDTLERTFKMRTSRLLMPYVLLGPLIIFAIPNIIRGYVVAKQTDFKLNANGVGSYYSLFTTKNIEFSRDKITGVVVQRNLIDRIFGTCTVMFWSIGAETAVQFLHIPYEEGMESVFTRKAGIVEDEEFSVIRPEFRLVDMMMANLGKTVAVLAVLAASVITALLLPLFWLAVTGILLVYGVITIILRRRYKKASLRLGEHTVSLRIGWLRHRQYYALHDNVKDISTIRYPGSSKGQVWFNVAGEHAKQTVQGKKTRQANGFGVDYIAGSDSALDILDNLIDLILLRRFDTAAYERLITDIQTNGPSVVMQSRPSLKNTLVPIVFLHVITVVLIVILPVTILVHTIWLRRISYTIENYRVIRRSGVLYRRQTSIIFPRLDYIKSGQGFFNKMFKNGNLYLYTTGSSNAELTLANMPDYTAFYQELQKQYEQ